MLCRAMMLMSRRGGPSCNAEHATSVRVVGVSQMAISERSDEVLVTHALGSCVGVAVYDPLRRVGALIHCMLPSANVDPAKARERPATYVDSGMPLLLRMLFARGAERRRLVVTVAGAARATEHRDLFRVGERNYAMLRKVLWQHGILISAEEVGGTCARTMMLHVATGKTVLRVCGRERVM
ncbi:MAG: chemotaxis protein CheD [Chitinivibrionales bacterium]|nr:chemotaxis protein CheD [Chitinivibrionales bacterium]